MTRTVLVATLACVLHAASALAQPAAEPAPAPPPEHLGFGVSLGAGFPASIAAGRFSVPFHPRGALDLDVGRSRHRGRQTTTYGAAVRWLRRERHADGYL